MKERDVGAIYRHRNCVLEYIYSLTSIGNVIYKMLLN